LKPGRRGSGGVRRLRPPAEASRRCRRSRAPLHLARCRRQRQALEAPNRQRWCRLPAEWRRSRRRPKRCRCRANASPTSPPILVWTTILVVSRWLRSLYIYIYIIYLSAGSDEGQLAVVAPAAATTTSAVVPKARHRPSRLSGMRRALRPAGWRRRRRR
jgi:hypothetical protein